jgi:hypothetical protein
MNVSVKSGNLLEHKSDLAILFAKQDAPLPEKFQGCSSLLIFQENQNNPCWSTPREQWHHPASCWLVWVRLIKSKQTLTAMLPLQRSKKP